ncbi:MAG: glycosyltransferase [Pseudomonadota bacterium]
MKILFVHQNFPGQFKHLAPALAARGHEVVGLGINGLQQALPGVRYVTHNPQNADMPVSMRELFAKMARGESAARAMQALKAEGFVPDVVFAHSGWGEAFFIKDVFPSSRLLVYAEYFYGAEGGDSGFDPEFSSRTPEMLRSMRIKNTHLLHALSAADRGLSPTKFQRQQHPDWAQDRIDVIHDGIQTDIFCPNPAAFVTLGNGGPTLRPGDEVVTFVARQLEPYRGYHIFMRALPKLLKLRPQARVVIVGGDGASYGSAAPAGSTWKNIFLSEVVSQLDRDRVYFVGSLPHAVLTQLFQVSAAHVYLTYPFVLSWSLMEAMSIGTLIIGSKTGPVEELIQHGKNGLLTDFFDPEALAETVADALKRRHKLTRLRDAARQTIVRGYDLERVCLPAQERLVTAAG